MRKRIFIALLVLLITTGCTCEYNVQIANDTYRENIVLIANNSEEVASFNQKWQVSTNKNINNVGLDPSSEVDIDSNIYEYKLSGNSLSFNHIFLQDDYPFSTAVSKCYNSLNVSNYNDKIIISTSSKTICFDNYPSLDSVTINVTVDKKVVSNNADIIKGNVYTWNLSRENSNKSINMVLDNTNEQSNIDNDENNNKEAIIKPKRDYTLFVFSVILLIIFLIGYLIYIKIKKNESNMDV